jgi:hypothetical protein
MNGVTTVSHSASHQNSIENRRQENRTRRRHSPTRRRPGLQCHCHVPNQANRPNKSHVIGWQLRNTMARCDGIAGCRTSVCGNRPSRSRYSLIRLCEHAPSCPIRSSQFPIIPAHPVRPSNKPRIRPPRRTRIDGRQRMNRAALPRKVRTCRISLRRLGLSRPRRRPDRFESACRWLCHGRRLECPSNHNWHRRPGCTNLRNLRHLSRARLTSLSYVSSSRGDRDGISNSHAGFSRGGRTRLSRRLLVGSRTVADRFAARNPRRSGLPC